MRAFQATAPHQTRLPVRHLLSVCRRREPGFRRHEGVAAADKLHSVSFVTVATAEVDAVAGRVERDIPTARICWGNRRGQRRGPVSPIRVWEPVCIDIHTALIPVRFGGHGPVVKLAVQFLERRQSPVLRAAQPGEIHGTDELTCVARTAIAQVGVRPLVSCKPPSVVFDSHVRPVASSRTQPPGTAENWNPSLPSLLALVAATASRPTCPSCRVLRARASGLLHETKAVVPAVMPAAKHWSAVTPVSLKRASAMATPAAPSREWGRDPGLQSERTALAWSRTALALAANAALTIRSGLTNQAPPVLFLGAVLLVAAAMLVPLSGWRRKQLLKAQKPISAQPRLLLAVCLLAMLASAAAILATLPNLAHLRA
jgi:uncharacterized membrane protein YidH (DUF202 family)